MLTLTYEETNVDVGMCQIHVDTCQAYVSKKALLPVDWVKGKMLHNYQSKTMTKGRMNSNELLVSNVYRIIS
jgi:hypothetical protein